MPFVDSVILEVQRESLIVSSSSSTSLSSAEVILCCSSTTSWKEKVFSKTHSFKCACPLHLSSPFTSWVPVFQPWSPFRGQIVTAGGGRESLGSFLLTICTSCLFHLARVDKPKNRRKITLRMMMITVSWIFEQYHGSLFIIFPFSSLLE